MHSNVAQHLNIYRIGNLKFNTPQWYLNLRSNGREKKFFGVYVRDPLHGDNLHLDRTSNPR